MQVVFRTDASTQIGNGHLMRCLTLAETLRSGAVECQFICREHSGNLIEQIQLRGFVVHVLPVGTKYISTNELADSARIDHSAWLGTDWSEDAAQTKTIIGNTVADWLIIDHYALDARWESALRPFCLKLMVIDDLANRLHDCDLLLDQNLGRKVADYDQLLPQGCNVLAGPHYALLKSEFAALRDYSLQRRAKSKVEHLLISMGGVDQSNATGRILRALLDCLLPLDMRITVVMGPHAPWLDSVQALSKQMPQPTEVLVNVSNMAQLMADCDLAIGAAGGTAWERCCLGLPTLTLVLAENQRDGAAALAQCGSVKLVDCVSDVPQALRAILDLSDSGFVLSQMSQNSCLITDGNGVGRVRDAVCECYC